MSQYSAIKAATNAYIKSNGMREITGAILNSVMIATINALGKYYQFAGVADRDTDPGSPDENVIYITGTTGTYANFGGIVVNAGEMALLKWDGTWTKQVIKIIPESTSQLLNDSGFINNAVGNLLNYYLKSETYTKGQVDDLIAAVHQFEFVVADTLPTASADTMYKIYLIPAGDSEEDNYKDEYVTILEEGVYSWEKIGSTSVDLSDYPTNEQMAQAIDDAIAAYISSITASVDSNVGTPSVDVSYSSGVLTLAFHNLKGVQGDQGVPGPPGVTSVSASVDNNTGIPSVEASVNAGVLTLTFHNLKGLQGDTGSSVAYPFTLVNNTTTDDPLQALTAAMGKYLQDQVTQLEQEVSELFGTADADLDIADENGNVLARFEDGDFRVKNFDSAKAPQQGDTDPDFAIIDENGRAIVVLRDGNIQTKNFDSETFGKEWFVGKKVSIIGDSISTAPNHNAVEFTVLDSDISQGRTLQGYPTYYDIGTTIGGVAVTSGMVGVLTSFSPVAGDEGKTIGKPQNYNTAGTSGVSSYTETWWYKMATALGMEVLQNVSWSGASISSHEGNANDYKTSYAWHPAQINKLATRDAGGNTIKPDVVIIYRGTNDMTHSPYTSLTDFGADAMSIPDTDYSDSSYDFKVAYCMTIKKIREAYPQAKIIVCTLNLFKRLNDTQFPTNNGYNTLPEYNNAIREVANMMGCGLIEFDKDGITFENCYPTYISDNATHPTHPNPTGHTRMAEKAIIDIKNY